MRSILVKVEGVKEATPDQAKLTVAIKFDDKVTTAAKVAEALSKEAPRYKATVKS